ncbi:MAG: hypothetical protein WCX61_03185 [Candidatus Peribacteraceae bacterium]|jgi:A/G-specific adenine glycosylase
MRRHERIQGFVEEIWKWYSRHRRDLPWRRDLSINDRNERAYRVLVSEIMLQQTQVERVKVIYKRFIEKFPTLVLLAAASDGQVILAWRGMGYNSRALRLRDAARTLIKNHDGMFPCDMPSLRALPGVGHYTAAAIRNFAFGIPTPCLDTNIRRIVHRVFIGPEKSDGTWLKNDAYVLELATEILTRALTYSDACTTADWHAALMDFGSLVCTKRNPRWDICPLTARGLCKASYKVVHDPALRAQRSEPGRMMGARFVPNRIFRGKIVEELRDAPQGLALNDIGKRVCIDWSPSVHRQWLQVLMEKLRKDRLIQKKASRYVLAE